MNTPSSPSIPLLSAAILLMASPLGHSFPAQANATQHDTVANRANEILLPLSWFQVANPGILIGQRYGTPKPGTRPSGGGGNNTPRSTQETPDYGSTGGRGQGGGGWLIPPRGVVPPGNVRGIIQRSTCVKGDRPLTALVPFMEESQTLGDKKVTVTKVWGYTLQGYPTLWFYVPYIANNPKQPNYSAEFSLQHQGNTYRVPVPLPQRPGVVGVQLPKTQPELKADQQYRWFFSIYCGAEKESQIYVDGVIQRVDKPDLARRLMSLLPQQQVGALQKEGIWFDALTMVAGLRQQRSMDQRAEKLWIEMLKSVKLHDLADQPIVPTPAQNTEN